MQVEALRVCITDHDLGVLIEGFLPDDQLVDELSACIVDDGIVATGKLNVKKLVKVPFEALIRPWAEGEVVRLELANLEAVGPLGNMLKGILVSLLRRSLPELPGIDGDSSEIRCDLRKLLESKGIACEFEALKVQTHSGKLVLELSGSVDMAA